MAPASPSAAGLTIMPGLAASQYSICPLGAFSFKRTVRVSGVSIASISAIVSCTVLPARLPKAALRSRLRFTAAASTGVPSWKRAPARNVRVMSVRSALRVQDSARPGIGVPSAFSWINVS